MKNESNTSNSQRAIRKSCVFALGAALLFASAAPAQSNCHYSSNTSANCSEANNSGYVWVAVNGSWQPKAYYVVDNTRYWIYYYGPRLWSAENRDTHEVWVKNTEGQWQRYGVYLKDATRSLQYLGLLQQSQASHELTITIVPSDFRVDYCRTYFAYAQDLARYGVPIFPDILCETTLQVH